MSSVILADVESKINEVRDRLTNLSITLNCNEATTTTAAMKTTSTTTPVLTTRVKGRDERNTAVLIERNVNERCGQKSDTSASTGGLDRLVELAKREATHRQNSNNNHYNNNNNIIHKPNDSITSDRVTQPVNNREAQNTSCAVSEKSLTGLEAHTYYETTSAVPQLQYTHHIIPTALSNVSAQQTNVMPKRSAVPFQTSAERFAKIHKNTPTTELRTGMPTTSGTFDPFQAVQARLREKLRKSAVCSTTDSSPVDSTKSPSPDLEKVWQSTPSETNTTPRRNSQSDKSPNATQIWTDKTQKQQQEEEEPEEKYKPTVSRSPSVKAAAAAIRNVKEHFSSTAVNRVSRCSSSRSSAVGEHRHQQYHHYQPQQQQQQQQREKEKEKIPQRSSARPVQMNVRPRSSSIQRRETNITASVQPMERQSTPRRPSSVNSRRSSSSFRAQSPIPLKTAPQRTVLDVLTGAEVFALLRLRGVLVSRGDTGECALPETRCHSMYLSPEEHKQLVELRASLRLRSSSSSTAAKTNERRPSSARGHMSTPTTTTTTSRTTTRTTAAFDRASHSRRTTTSSRGGLPQW